MDSDPYSILGLDRTATNDEIKAQYRRLAKETHPDMFNNADDKIVAEQQFKEISNAYSTLIDEYKRGYLDAQLERSVRTKKYCVQ